MSRTRLGRDSIAADKEECSNTRSVLQKIFDDQTVATEVVILGCGAGDYNIMLSDLAKFVGDVQSGGTKLKDFFKLAIRDFLLIKRLKYSSNVIVPLVRRHFEETTMRVVSMKAWMKEERAS